MSSLTFHGLCVDLTHILAAIFFAHVRDVQRKRGPRVRSDPEASVACDDLLTKREHGVLLFVEPGNLLNKR